MCGAGVCYGIGNRMSGSSLSGSRRYLVILACILVLSTGIVGAALAQTEPNMSVDDISLTGNGILDTEQNDTLIAGWRSTTVTTNVSGDPGQYEACLTMDSAVNERVIECKATEVNTTGATNLSFENPEWPANMSGQQTLSLVVRNNTNDTLATSSQQVTILHESGDNDNDGVPNRKEVNKGIDPTQPDTDQDNLSDSKELYNTSTNPNKKDTDGDSLSDYVEVTKYDSSPLKNDTDGDGLNDSVEITKHDTEPDEVDSDGDTLSDWDELKKHGTNPNKADTDGDGLDDDKEIARDTDPRDPDTDGDGLNDGKEVSSPATDPTNPDTDGDGLEDGEEVNKYGTNPRKADTDGDGVTDAVEIRQGTDPTGGGIFLLDPMENPIKTAATAVGLVALIGGVYWWRRRSATDAAQTDETEPAPVTAEVPPEETPTITADGEDPMDESTVVTEPITDEDRIQQLLDENGGRLHQSEIVSKTGWSKSKVSRLLSRMEDDGLITKISVGRENLITRSGDEPRHAGSAFED